MKKILIILASVVVGGYLLLNILSNEITDVLWYFNVGFEQVFFTNLITKSIIFTPIFIILVIVLPIYFKNLLDKYIALGQVSINKHDQKIFKNIIWLVSGVLSLFIAMIMTSSLWFKILQFINSVDFQIQDPIFSKDISFYFFTIPLLNSILASGIIISVFFVVATFFFYGIMIQTHPPAEGSLYDFNEFAGRPNFKSIFRKDLVKYALQKIAVFSFVFFFLLGLYFYLQGFYLMYSQRGVAFGASYTDINITLRVYQALSILSIIGAFTFIYGLLKNKRKFSVVTAAVIAIVFIGGNIIGLGFQQLVVEPDEINKEREFLEYNIQYTQKAFGLDQVETVDFPVEQQLDQEAILENSGTIDNIRINDARPLKQTYNQIQVIRLYYEFYDIDIDRYIIDGVYTEVFITPRELSLDKLDAKAQTWLNKHLKYTHGYGIVMSPVNKVTSEGQPELLIRNIPPITDTDLAITRPEIYFGELTDEYIIVNSLEKEFDYPSGSDNKEVLYEGTAGIPLSGINRLLFAFRENSMKLFFSPNVTSESRIVFHRNIKERVEKIAPFLEYDNNPYIVLHENGKLYWIIDAYTVDRRYPYSQLYTFKNKQVNYIRNSVKVVVDAFNGDVSYYIVDEEDPLLKTYQNIYDEVFTPIDQMDPYLRQHIKYPQDLFNLQATIYRQYHVDNPTVFYNGEDIWDIANEKFMSNVQQIESNYVMFRLPGQEEVEFSIIIPYTPKEKPNMTSLLVGRNDGEHYGKLLVYRFPKDKTIDGPMMVESRIDQNSTISPQLTLWSQEGSRVLRGNVIVVPVENSLLYIEPVYLQADNQNSIPEMKRVIVSYNEQIVMDTTLQGALDIIFGQASPDQPTIPGQDQTIDKQKLLELRREYQELQEQMDQVERLLEELTESLQEEN